MRAKKKKQILENGLDDGSLKEPLVVLEQTPAGPIAHTFYNKIKIVPMTEVEKEMKIMQEQSVADAHLVLTDKEIRELKLKR